MYTERNLFETILASLPERVSIDSKGEGDADVLVCHPLSPRRPPVSLAHLRNLRHGWNNLNRLDGRICVAGRGGRATEEVLEDGDRVVMSSTCNRR